MKGSEVLRTSSPENAVHPGTRGCEKPGKEKKKDVGLFQVQFQMEHSKNTLFFLANLSNFIIWLAPRADKMTQIARCDCLPERPIWSHLGQYYQNH